MAGAGKWARHFGAEVHIHRDDRIGSEVIRRFYENRVILEPLGVADRAEAELLARSEDLLRDDAGCDT